MGRALPNNMTVPFSDLPSGLIVPNDLARERAQEAVPKPSELTPVEYLRMLADTILTAPRSGVQGAQFVAIEHDMACAITRDLRGLANALEAAQKLVEAQADQGPAQIVEMGS